MKERSILFPCGDLTLEGVYCLPDKEGAFPGVVICHPHPLYGGSMHNNVVHAVASALTDSYIIAFMFNFRGVGRSQGSFGGGIGEMDDARAAIEWLISQTEIDKEHIGIAGYSFGASVALPVACADGHIKGFALISPALQEQHIAQIKTCTKPKLIISGSDDDIISPASVEHMHQEAAEPKALFLVDGADHFWGWKAEAVMADKTAAFFKDVFGDIP